MQCAARKAHQEIFDRHTVDRIGFFAWSREADIEMQFVG
jgi:hypothetical protein